MKNIESPAGSEALRQLVRSRALLAFDFDGTLAPLAAHPAEVHLPQATAEVLRRLQNYAPMVIVSGRSVDDVQSFCEDWAVRIIGNHGAEGVATTAVLEQARTLCMLLCKRLQEWLRVTPGIQTAWIEEKTFSVTVHGRAEEIAALHTACRQWPEALALRVMPGKACVNFVPTVLPHKGQAVQHLLSEWECQACLFIGDDVTDEDVFTARLPVHSVMVRVGEDAGSQAGYYCASQTEVLSVLRQLLELYESGSS